MMLRESHPSTYLTNWYIDFLSLASQDNIKLQKNRKEVEKKNEELKALREETAGRNLSEIEDQLNAVKTTMKKLDAHIHG